MTKMNLKKISRKRIKLKIIIFFLILYLSFAYAFYTTLKNNPNLSNENFINLLVNGGNSYALYDFKLVNMVNNTIKFLIDIDITKPETMFNNTIFAQKKDSNNILLEYNDQYNLEELEKISQYMEDPNKVDITKPVIYLYNTHQLENYNNDSLAIYGITPNVLMASYILKEKLNKKGVSTIVEDTNLSEFLKYNKWNYSESYKASRLLFLEKKEKYPTLEYYIDLHRDSVSDKYTRVNINDKNYAKILFVVGLEHDNYSKNLETANKLNNLISASYPTLTRGIYQKQGKGVNGIYNQDLSSNAILLEIGGVDNKIEEVYNTLEVISDALVQLAGVKYE